MHISTFQHLKYTFCIFKHHLKTCLEKVRFSSIGPVEIHNLVKIIIGHIKDLILHHGIPDPIQDIIIIIKIIIMMIMMIIMIIMIIIMIIIFINIIIILALLPSSSSTKSSYSPPYAAEASISSGPFIMLYIFYNKYNFENLNFIQIVISCMILNGHFLVRTHNSRIYDNKMYNNIYNLAHN